MGDDDGYNAVMNETKICLALHQMRQNDFPQRRVGSMAVRLTDSDFKMNDDNDIANEQCDKLKKEIHELKAKHSKEKVELNKQINVFKQQNEVWKKKYTKMEKERNELRSNLSLYEGTSKKMNAMNMKQLGAMETRLLKSWQNVRDCKERLFECWVCKENQRNIIFVGCGHCL